MANEMLARAADRGGMNKSPGSVADRIYEFYLSQGLPPSAALEQVKRLISSGMYDDTAERYTNVRDRAMELARRAEDQARMRANPQMLGEGIAAPAPADLPGYDPTAGRMTGTAETPRLSQPMTRAEIEELRVTRPMVQDTRPAWVQGRTTAPGMSPFTSRAESGFLSAYLGQPGYNARAADYEAQKRAYNLAREAASGPAQTYVPAAQGQPILNAGEEMPRAMSAAPPAGLIGAAAAAPASAPAPAAPPAAAPAAFPMMVAPESMRLPTSYGQPERRAVQIAQSVMPPPPPPRPVEVSRPAAEPASRALWEILNRTDNPADFVRADKAMLAERAGRAEGGGIPEGMMGARPMPSLDLPPMDGSPSMSDMPPLGGMSPASKPTAGAGAGGRDAAINKALEIIHHLVIRGR